MVLFYVKGVPIGGVTIMLALLTSMGGFIIGYDRGQISDILLMDDFKLRFAQCSTPGNISTCEFSNVRAGLIVSLLSIGGLIGALVGAPIADILGRRYAISTECIVFIFGVFIQVTTMSEWPWFAVGRFVSGLGIGALSAAIPMYQAETAPPPIRGSLIATYQLFITFGILVAYCVSFGAREIPDSGSWRTVVVVGVIWALILGIGILFMPESPRWLAARNRLGDARDSLARLYGISTVNAKAKTYILLQVVRMRMNMLRDTEMQDGWLACFSSSNKTGYRTFFGMALQLYHYLNGASYFLHFGLTVFQSVGIQDSFVAKITFGAVNFFCTFGGIYVMEKFGRRIPLVVGGLWQATWVLVFAAASTAKESQDNPNIVMILSACMFIFSYAMTWAPGIWIIIGETFATRTRAKQGALVTACGWLFGALFASLGPSFITINSAKPNDFVNAINFASTINFARTITFVANNVSGASHVFFFLYESSDLTLESVDDMYNDPNCQPLDSYKWAAEGFASREEFTRFKEA